MQLRTLLLLVVAGLIAVFVALNWAVVMAPSTLSLGFMDIQASLGLVMLGLMVLLATLFLVYIVYLQGSVLMDGRRHARELQANRELADKAEASRFSELRAFLEAELTKLAAQNVALKTELGQRIEESGNGIAACIGELEDRLEHKTPPAGN
ncbi:LapA family protein [Craterilacuibacter sinensis]|uniref:LapA family protein n=1 Tax=Craterilacuibacter sinensis TaxID=2686017 RepID=A0A845BIS8_9NEIS|nr:LapA family protein [Craterilacuibacter sinensis]MXR36657.1 LapA family protein [Craterilacuibacter sinensis]